MKVRLFNKNTTSRVTSWAEPSALAAALLLAPYSVTSLAASDLAWLAAPPTSWCARARNWNSPHRRACSFAWTTPSPCQSPPPPTTVIPAIAETRSETSSAPHGDPSSHPARRASLSEAYFFGKFGSAFTSLICFVCRSLWAATSSTNSYAAGFPCRRQHHLLLRQRAQKIFRRRDVLRHLRHGPVVRRRLEVPLGLRQPSRCFQDALLCRLQVLQRAILLRLRHF